MSYFLKLEFAVYNIQLWILLSTISNVLFFTPCSLFTLWPINLIKTVQNQAKLPHNGFCWDSLLKHPFLSFKIHPISQVLYNITIGRKKVPPDDFNINAFFLRNKFVVMEYLVLFYQLSFGAFLSSSLTLSECGNNLGQCPMPREFSHFVEVLLTSRWISC